MIQWVRPSILVASAGIDSLLKGLVRVKGLTGLKHLSLKPCDRDSLLAGVSSIIREHRLYLVALTTEVRCGLLCDLCSRLPREQLLHVCVKVSDLQSLMESLSSSCLDKVRGFVVMASNTNEVVRAFSSFERFRVRGLLTKKLYLMLRGLESVSFNEDILDYVIRMCGEYGAEPILCGAEPDYLEAWGFRRCGRVLHALGLRIEEYVKGSSKLYVVNGVDSENLVAFSIDEVKLIISPKWVSGISIESPIPTCSYKIRLVKGIVKKMFRSSEALTVKISPCLTLTCGGVKAVIDESVIKFLKVINERGSLKSASESLHVPLTTMRKRIVGIEELLGVKLIDTRRGGIGRGGTRLTSDALRLIKAFEAMRECFRREFRVDSGREIPS